MDRKPTAHRAIILSVLVAIAAFLGLMCAACMLIRPQLFQHPHWGISYFGSQRSTLLPYYGGFVVVLGCLAWITRLVGTVRGRWRPIRTIFLWSTVLSAGIAATSYMRGPFLYWSHIMVCLALLLWVLGAEVWVLRQPGTGWLDYTGAVLIVVGGVIVNLSGDWIGVLGVYTLGEVLVFIGAFMCLGKAALRAVAE